MSMEIKWARLIVWGGHLKLADMGKPASGGIGAGESRNRTGSLAMMWRQSNDATRQTKDPR
jgi:hypothetical protein